MTWGVSRQHHPDVIKKAGGNGVCLLNGGVIKPLLPHHERLVSLFPRNNTRPLVGGHPPTTSSIIRMFSDKDFFFIKRAASNDGRVPLTVCGKNIERSRLLKETLCVRVSLRKKEAAPLFLERGVGLPPQHIFGAEVFAPPIVWGVIDVQREVSARKRCCRDVLCCVRK